MATNHYFQSGIPGGRSSEQNLMEDLIIECLKIYGFDVYYLPRQSVNPDLVLTEDPLNKFTNSYPLEMYLSNTSGFEGEGDLLTKFGVEIRDTATFIVARRRWEEVIARSGNAQLSTRPAEGDLLYFPLTKAFFEIRRVEAKDPFFQLGKFYVFKLECELYQYSGEAIETGTDDIDNAAANKTFDIGGFELLLEDSSKMLLEYYATSKVVLESYNLQTIDPLSQNNTFTDESDILDFSERNPFGEVL